jgi:hypothetical protein
MKKKVKLWMSFIGLTGSLAVILYVLLGTGMEPITEQTKPQLPEHQPSAHQRAEEPRAPQYDMELQFDPGHSQLWGTTRIKVWNRAQLPTREVNIHLFLNAFEQGNKVPVLDDFIDKAYPSGIQHGSMEISNVEVAGQRMTTYSEAGTVLRIDLQKDWMPNEKVEIQLEWKATVPEIHHRLGAKEGAYWFGNVLPILAVYDDQWMVNDYEVVGDPFFSEASDYTVNITIPSHYNVISTGEEISSQSKDGKKKIRIKAKQVRDFAFAVSANHKVKSIETTDGKKINIYYRYTGEAQIDHTLKQVAGMVEYMEKRVGPYPYPELDIFENEMFITGMEYPGFVFVQAKRLDSQTGHQTVLHEIAHQWFYNVVGNNGWIPYPPLDDPVVQITLYLPGFSRVKDVDSSAPGAACT